VQLVKLGGDGVDVVERIGTMRVARELRDLPGREIGEDADRELAALGLQAADLIVDVDLGVRAAIGCSKSKNATAMGARLP
jgi:hypothetical protein